MRLFYVLIFMVFSTSICFAENDKKESNKSFTVGWGTITCYDFLHPGYQKDFAGRDLAVFAWIQGFMTAKNYYTNDDVALLSLDIDEQLVIIKVYCEEHKRNKVIYAADYLYGELYKKSKQEK